MNNKTTLTKRTRGKDSKDHYLNLTKGTSISICDENGYIIGYINYKYDGHIGVKVHAQEGWTTITTNKYGTPTVKEGVNYGLYGEQEGGKVILSPEINELERANADAEGHSLIFTGETK